jgi:H+-transporting ATPase
VEQARMIFERMNSYAIYRITETIRIMFFVVLAMLVFNFYPITTVLVILLALLNDLPIMTIAYDNTWLDPKPVRWNMRRVLTISTVLGLIGVAETFLLLWIAREHLSLTTAQMQSFIYLKLAVAGHLTLLVVRSKEPFWKKPHPSAPLLWAVLGTQAVAALIVGLGIIVEPIPWSLVGLVWAYCLAWMFIEDLAKLQLYRHLEQCCPRHLRFFSRMQKRV